MMIINHKLPYQLRDWLIIYMIMQNLRSGPNITPFFFGPYCTQCPCHVTFSAIITDYYYYFLNNFHVTFINVHCTWIYCEVYMWREF